MEGRKDGRKERTHTHTDRPTLHTTSLNSFWQMKAMPLNTSRGPSDGQALKSHTGTHSDPQGCIWWQGRLRREENGTEQSGQGAWWGALHLGKMASVAMQLGTKAIYTPAPLSPLFLPKLHCYWSGLLDWRHRFGVCMHWGSTDLDFWRPVLCTIVQHSM